ncbi:MAG: hypothetical protein KDM64_10950 [Verrucomicrobiae bacterium]|nr:hypothetical protein [Verrucomicrobiae bacterium]
MRPLSFADSIALAVLLAGAIPFPSGLTAEPKPHPAAVPNTHPPGDVDNPAMVPFIVPDPATLPGIVVDEGEATLVGEWAYSTHTPPYVGIGYLHDQKTGKGEKSATFTPDLPTEGYFEVRLAHCHNVRRATNTPVTIHHAFGEATLRINQQDRPEHGQLFRTLGRYFFRAGKQGWVRVSNEGTDPTKVAIADAVQFLPIDPTPGPYTGPSVKGTDVSTLKGKVVCGYQGWFACEGDGLGMGWMHWARNPREPLGPGNVTVDLWPDVSELGPEERYATGFKVGEGKPAEVYSSMNPATIHRHFEWMRDYGIDGAFVQRFANGLHHPPLLIQKNAVLAGAREAANRTGRSYAVMYDLSGLKSGEVDRVREDWAALRGTMQIGQDPAYQLHEGKPLVAVWGVGFSDDRPYSLEECRALIAYLKEDGCTVMLGVPSWWREGSHDASNDPTLPDILAMADILSPWTIGRYQKPEQAASHAEKIWKPDIAWCRERGLNFLPVVFPGFSWHNLKGDPLAAIPRLKGQFLWSQFVAAKAVGAEMIYVAMFDEVDEGTAIFKCTNDVPVGNGVSFLTYENLPSDHYLKLTGLGGRMLRGEIPATPEMPAVP